MQPSYEETLDAALEYLRTLKASGQKYVQVSPAVWQQLQKPPPARPRLALPVSPPPKAAPLPVSVPPLSPARPTAVAAPGPSRGVEKASAIQALRERALACLKCPHLVHARKNVVFGVGNIDAELMFVGEAPGADEDAQGEPFVGKAGQLLTRIIETMGLSRGTVYIANVLKCRPDTPGQAFGNRKPTAEEMKTCLPYLQSQIDLIQPKVLVALGGTAMEGLLGSGTVGITRLRGHFQSFRGIPLMPTYHPAYVLRNQALATKRELWEDMLQVMEKLHLPISEKQRGYFFKPATEQPT